MSRIVALLTTLCSACGTVTSVTNAESTGEEDPSGPYCTGQNPDDLWTWDRVAGALAFVYCFTRPEVPGCFNAVYDQWCPSTEYCNQQFLCSVAAVDLAVNCIDTTIFTTFIPAQCWNLFTGDL